MEPRPETRLVVVSNRLPITLWQESGEWQVHPGSGGLVTALVPVLKNRGGLWIGWLGTSEAVEFEKLEPATEDLGYKLIPVGLTAEDVKGFYYGFANEIIWPLFHDLQTRCNFAPEYWQAYVEVNRKFAEVVARESRPTDYIWVHDYHLMLAGRTLRQRVPGLKTGFFLHIPFPSVDIFLKLPWRVQVLQALLDYDLIGFQTMRDRRNFIECIQYLHPEIKTRGRGAVLSIPWGERQVRIGAFPIGIDFHGFAERADSQEVADQAWLIHEALPNRQIILGLDRLDYTKGIPERLEAFRNALSRYPDLHGKVTLVQFVVPSREEVPMYQTLKSQIERMVGEINGRFTRPGWVPIHYLYRRLEWDELIAYYRTSEIALVTPLKDGMNLVAKEYCACTLEENGVLILSEFAGAAAQLHRNALLVNPYHIEAVADAIHRAFQMEEGERKFRMRRLRESIRTFNVFDWVDSFLQAAFAIKLRDFPTLEEYHPPIHAGENPPK
ncbi:MAG: trehalose-6-phosphate synthase [Deltaproteobacteria bacterium RBG_13_61_14]|nr:MAG: trehalose-6-phosphate synthase [Deltaproteobacteria bacterium RBG_13_61_14]